jgi:partner of Y14 and mago protein
MTLPDLYPETTTAGIAVDPKTLERVVPTTRRADGS